jgi:uncharacterized protein (DUF362 family)
MKSERSSEWIRNILLVALLAAIIVFTAYHEGYLASISIYFWILLAAGIAVCVWLALGISTGRLLSLLLVIFIIEYGKEALGIRYKLWIYSGEGSQFNFGVWAWVLGGLGCYTVATRVAMKLIGKLKVAWPWWLNYILLILLFLAIPLTMSSYRQDTGVLLWLFYILMLGIGLAAATRVAFPVFAGIVVTAWIVGWPSEYIGSVASKIWVFPNNPNYPPFYLIFCCWPLEIFAQYALSGVLANEPLNKGFSNIKRDYTMDKLAREEHQLKIFLTISALTYLVVGFAFLILPNQILNIINKVSASLAPSLRLIPTSPGKFWVCLSFSMMMTITALCCIARHNVRRNIGYMAPLLVAKAASALSALFVFIFLPPRYFAVLAITLVDGSIFWVTLFFFLRANRAFFETQTAFLRKKPTAVKSSGEATVVVAKGDDKFSLLEEVISKTGFFDLLEKRFKESGKSKEGFSIVIKPNFMYMHSKKDISTYTDPKLVEALVDKIFEKGFTNITLVEAQSTLGNYYNNREVVKVAEYIGYSSKSEKYQIVDLTEEMVPYDYGGRLGKHFVGPTWRDADFRISFAKNKTHVFCHYTLTLKNIYGTLPMQNKLKEYHTKREYDWPTIETLKHFPVHFGLIDAFYSADGQFGVIVDPTPRLTKTMIGGENLLAVDWVGAKKMGLDPDDPKIGRFLPLAVEAFGKPEVNWVGDKSVYEPWENVSEIFIQSLDVIEEAYAFSNWWFSCLTAMDKYFSFKIRALPILIMRKILSPFKRIFYRYDYLP